MAGANWELVRRPAPPDLARWVTGFSGFAELGGAPVVRREMPTLAVPVILVLGPGFRLRESAAEAWRPLARSFVAGLTRTPVQVATLGTSVCLQADLTQAGARRFLAAEPGSLAGQVVPLADAVGAWADRLAERLAAVPGWTERLDMAVAAFRQRLGAGREGHPAVAGALALLTATGGGAPVAEAARQAGVSRKHLAALFRREIGAAPKEIARLLRFEAALARLRCGTSGPLAGLAAECGYADEAHFVREVRAHAGETPARLRARIDADGGVIDAGA